MNIKINRQAFLDGINSASKIIDPKSLSPATTGVLIEVGVDKLTIISTNNSTSFKVELYKQNSDLEIITPGTILVKPKFIIDTLRKLENQFIKLSVFEESELEIITEKSSLKIGLLDPEDFPLLGFVENGLEITLSPVEFKNTINQLINSINPYKERTVLTGLNLKTKEDSIVFSATDLFKISLKKIPINTQGEKINIIIPHKTLTELIKLIENVKKLKIVVFDNYTTFVFDNKTFQSILVDGNYPDVESAFPSVFGTSIKVKTKKILKLLNRFELPFESSDPTINLNIKKNEITLKTTVDSVKYEETFNDFEFGGEEIEEVKFNTRFILEAIKTFDCEDLEIKFSLPSRMAVISSEEEPKLKQIILPRA
ncbi:DNA polymerase III subunit beta [Entomoplasma ellychniae]|uniref:DNA polymerase III subunit beta n=1 Tax=Entomoplasma ellychniae TaxID=2114 RepID=A0A8E2UA42_9MOLU|nr:DNA polymerase III subunit beta [Entomoplasma ellychniae]PPE04799.1 DNA polymerase III subunit beta [Entomoplasma ellychniae]